MNYGDQVAPVELDVWSQSSQSSSTCRASRASRARHVEPVEPVELDVSSESSYALRLARHSQNAWARHVECVESSRVEPSGIWAYVCTDTGSDHLRWRALWWNMWPLLTQPSSAVQTHCAERCVNFSRFIFFISVFLYLCKTAVRLQPSTGRYCPHFMAIATSYR